MTIIREYVRLFEIISADAKELAYWSNEADAQKCIDGYAKTGITATYRELASKKFIFRTDTKKHDLRYFETLFQEARKYFPLLSRRDIEVVHYAGSQYRGTFGIEFPSSANAPAGFTLINETEETF